MVKTLSFMCAVTVVSTPSGSLPDPLIAYMEALTARPAGPAMAGLCGKVPSSSWTSGRHKETNNLTSCPWMFRKHKQAAYSNKCGLFILYKNTML